MAYERQEALIVAQSADYIVNAYVEKYGDELLEELQTVVVGEIVDAVEAINKSGEDDGLDPSGQGQVDETVLETVGDGENEEE
jgi:hypothetical protein